MKKYWNWIRNEDGERILRLEGPIDDDSFWGDEITPDAFREELEAEEGDVTVWLNSPGGNVFAAASIYNMLCDHKGKVTVKIDAIAASAASVVAMAGDCVLMSPVALLMLHDPMTIAMGNTQDMEKAITTLNEVKESIINAYVRKTGLSRNRVSKMMSDETWLNAKKAVELGFADDILFSTPKDNKGEKENEADQQAPEARLYSTRLMGQSILNRLGCAAKDSVESAEVCGEAEGPSDDIQPAAESVTGMFEEAIGEHSADPDEAETQPAPDEQGASDEPGDTPAVPDKEIASTDSPPADTPTKNQIVIGLDGKTPDGAMPYQILRDKLEWLK